MGDTVWIASYPKSGNTWMRAVYTALLTLDEVRLSSLSGGGFPASRDQFDTVLGLRSSLLTADEIDLLRPRVDEVVDNTRSGLALRKCHDAYFRGPAGEPILSSAATRAAIYVVRDPRDVAVSYAHHTGWSHERIVEVMADPDATMGERPGAITNHLRQRLGTWSDHVNSWLDDPNFPVHLVRYEDCSADPIATFGAAFEFAGLDVDSDALRLAVERSSFERLRDTEAISGFRERPPELGQFFRRGEVGSWRTELAPTLAEQIEHDHHEVMARLDYQ